MKLIRAKRRGTASCGHVILFGDIIGYYPHEKKTRCTVCAAIIADREGKRKQREANERMKVE